MHLVGPILVHSKWFDSDKHAQLTADAYESNPCCDSNLRFQRCPGQMCTREPQPTERSTTTQCQTAIGGRLAYPR